MTSTGLALPSKPSALDPMPDPASLAGLVPPDTLLEARRHRDGLARLLSRERGAAADFLLALADFDRRRGWEALGHASLFDFLHRELGLSRGGAFFRQTAARLAVRHPEVLKPLRDGRLCITSVVELAKVVTPENLPEVLPRFFGCSSREARDVAAALAPRVDAPARTVVTSIRPVPSLREAASAVHPSSEAVGSLAGEQAWPALATPAAVRPSMPSPGFEAVQSTELALTLPVQAPPADVEPLTAELRRLHVTVSAAFLAKVARARGGLSYARPGATTEQVLEAALDLLLEHQAKRKAQVRRPRRQAQSPASSPDLPAAHGRSRHVPAAVEREVRLRDGDRCQWPLDTDGVCGATTRVELDHLEPFALGGPSTAANLRCLCDRHNRRAAELRLGEVVVTAGWSR